MNPEKAIEILELAKDDPDAIDINDLIEAEDLGIEALTRLQILRNHGVKLARPPLPGETEE